MFPTFLFSVAFSCKPTSLFKLKKRKGILQNSWALLFLINLTQTEVNSLFGGDYFQLRIYTHLVLVKENILPYIFSFILMFYRPSFSLIKILLFCVTFHCAETSYLTLMNRSCVSFFSYSCRKTVLEVLNGSGQIESDCIVI